MSPDQQPTFRFYRGEELKEDGKKERRRRIVRGGGSLVRELWRQREEGLFEQLSREPEKPPLNQSYCNLRYQVRTVAGPTGPIREAAIPNPV